MKCIDCNRCQNDFGELSCEYYPRLVVTMDSNFSMCKVAIDRENYRTSARVQLNNKKIILAKEEKTIKALTTVSEQVVDNISLPIINKTKATEIEFNKRIEMFLLRK